MSSQVTNRVMLIKPSCFNYNPETAADNEFQSALDGLSASQVQERALKEFECLEAKLKEINVDVKVFQDTLENCPDAVFPNNWISFHHDESKKTSKIAIYPMLSDVRKLERRPDILKYWKDSLNAVMVDYSIYEQQSQYLEGTGSMVLDREFKIAYAAISPRTNIELLKRFCSDFGYTPVSFKAQLPSEKDGKLHDVYHTNVMMSVCSGFAIVCVDSIQDDEEKERVLSSLKQSGREIVSITPHQVCEFAGNVLQVAGQDGLKHLMMSSRAHTSYTPDQLSVLNQYCDSLTVVPLDVIEKAGGGGVRCIIAEVFPPYYLI